MTEVDSPRRGPAGSEHTGRSCPYCRFPLKEGAAMVACGVCGAAHHGDCWDDNQGCAVVACAGGPPAPGSAPVPSAPQPTTTASIPATHAVPPPPPAPAWGPPASGGSGGRNALLVTAVLVLALAVAGAAVAFVATRKDAPAAVPTVTTVHEGTSSGDTVASDAPTTDPVTPPDETETETETETTPADDGTIPAELTRGEMREDIRAVLLEHHQDLVDGNYSAAWDLMTARKQRQKERDPGYAQWVDDQKTLARYLDPSGIDVRIESVDRATGVVRVMVTGMDWSKPSARCSSWSGLTWVRWEDGAWRYDPGYSTTPQRTREWKNRFSELLGGSC
jgi:hypothetical protein